MLKKYIMHMKETNIYKYIYIILENHSAEKKASK